MHNSNPVPARLETLQSMPMRTFSLSRRAIAPCQCQQTDIERVREALEQPSPSSALIADYAVAYRQQVFQNLSLTIQIKVAQVQ